MRHIKLFEGFNKDEYYEEIEELYDDEDTFSPISSELKKSIKSWFELTDDKICSLGFYITEELNIDIRDYNINISSLDGSLWLNLMEMVDEYYYIQFGHIENGQVKLDGHYRCDQLDGVKKFLKDKGIIK
jgi:hypothetical protein